MQEPSSSDTTPSRTVVMTGGSSGLGSHALGRLVEDLGTRLVLGVRDTGTSPAGVTAVALDLASLQSVRGFVAEVRRELAGAEIDALVLNAGAQFPDTSARTVDGFEPTFAVNHLAHVLIVRELLGSIAPDGRIVVTTSDTHDPDLFGMGPRQLAVEQWAHPEGRFSPMRAYSASKLGNLLTVQKLAALPEVTDRGIAVIAYNPGLTGGTGLGRAQPAPVRWLMRSMGPVMRVVGLLRPQMRMGTPQRAGEVLADLVDGRATPPAGRVYASLVAGELTYPDPSTLAQDSRAADALWEASLDMLDELSRNASS